MNELNQLYLEIMNRGIAKISLGEESIDNTIDDTCDTRMGLTLTIRPNRETSHKIAEVIEQLKIIEPEQYYYPESDFHITLFDIITARQGFHYTELQKQEAEDLSKSVLNKFSQFKIKMNGLTVSESCVMVKGFYEPTMLHIRQNIRTDIAAYGLVLDERYPAKTSHITIARFRKKISNSQKYIDFIKEHANYDFGEFIVTDVQLVCHNWFDSKKEIIKHFELNDIS